VAVAARAQAWARHVVVAQVPVDAHLPSSPHSNMP
jgi:hypothetical protein